MTSGVPRSWDESGRRPPRTTATPTRWSPFGPCWVSAPLCPGRDTVTVRPMGSPSGQSLVERPPVFQHVSVALNLGGGVHQRTDHRAASPLGGATSQRARAVRGRERRPLLVRSDITAPLTARRARGGGLCGPRGGSLGPRRVRCGLKPVRVGWGGPLCPRGRFAPAPWWLASGAWRTCQGVDATRRAWCGAMGASEVGSGAWCVQRGGEGRGASPPEAVVSAGLPLGLDAAQVLIPFGLDASKVGARHDMLLRVSSLSSVHHLGSFPPASESQMPPQELPMLSVRK